jgi:hypothetical protein
LTPITVISAIDLEVNGFVMFFNINYIVYTLFIRFKTKFITLAPLFGQVNVCIFNNAEQVIIFGIEYDVEKLIINVVELDITYGVVIINV